MNDKPKVPRPTKLRFTLDSLKDLDFGKNPAAFNDAIDRCVKDCEDRPRETKPREIKLVFRMVPQVDATADGNTVCLDGVLLGCEIIDSVPKRRTKVYQMKPSKVGAEHGLTFHPEFPEDADTTGMFDADENSEGGSGAKVDKETGEVLDE